ncbi:MAG: ACT domain-containing protein [Eubacteriales bacterium]|nr:ACT domain-containing protein [Eubacteriales bacterium]MDY3332636.1 ACT domain-containing protein [Gallibacter sp.]
MNAVITVIGKDRVGILAATTAELAKANANILEVSQSILDDYFTMMMVVEIDDMNISLEELQDVLDKNVSKVKILVMHEDIFNAMHTI